MKKHNRRDVIKTTVASAALLAAGTPATSADPLPPATMKYGLVTYLWGKDLDLPTLLDVCEKSGIGGVELRTEHAHGVEPRLSKHERNEVKKRFDDCPVQLVGYGSNAEFHEVDQAKVRKNIELAKQYVELMHDCGGTGVKVKPNGLPQGVAHEKTIEQIGKSLNEVAEYGEGFGQQIRVEVHGRETANLEVVREIFQIADHPNATVCWNSNKEDLLGKGLKHNFDLVKERFGATVHAGELNNVDYPFRELMKLFKDAKYEGWILLETHTQPQGSAAEITAAIKTQRELFMRMVNA